MAPMTPEKRDERSDRRAMLDCLRRIANALERQTDMFERYYSSFDDLGIQIIEDPDIESPDIESLVPDDSQDNPK